MRQPNFLLASSSFLLLVAACGGSTTGGNGTTPTQPANVSIAKSSLERDSAAAIPAASLQAAVTANNAFAVDLYSHLRVTPSPANVLTSPISASLALTMSYAGASGETATQMATALHYGAGASSIFDGQNALTAALASRAATALASDQQSAGEGGQAAPSPADYQLQVVNSVWGQQTYTWAPPFLDTLAKSYGTGVYLEDFVNQFDAARTTINTWVSDATADKINDLLPEGALDDSTRMVLVNAIHLKLPWMNAFTVSQTAPAAFTTSAGTSVTTPFMNQTQMLSYVDDGNAQIVSLPMAGGALAVIIALPHGDLATYESSLAVTSAGIAAPTAASLVTLSLPKVTFTSPTFSLATALVAMGMTDAFDKSTADFSGMCASTPDGDKLYVGDVLQKAMVAIQETGVEAAAATAVVMVGASVAGPTPTPVAMTVNRPFLLSIVDVPTGAVLFLGHIVDPTNTGTP